MSKFFQKTLPNLLTDSVPKEKSDEPKEKKQKLPQKECAQFVGDITSGTGIIMK